MTDMSDEIWVSNIFAEESDSQKRITLETSVTVDDTDRISLNSARTTGVSFSARIFFFVDITFNSFSSR
jgi:hypothetical protein